MVTVFPTTPSIVGMRDVIYTPHRSRLMGVTNIKELLHSLTCCCIYHNMCFEGSQASKYSSSISTSNGKAKKQKRKVCKC
jgi:hypothetical protein